MEKMNKMISKLNYQRQCSGNSEEKEWFSVNMPSWVARREGFTDWEQIQLQFNTWHNLLFTGSQDLQQFVTSCEHDRSFRGHKSRNSAGSRTRNDRQGN